MASIDEELDGPPWVYPWRLRDGRELPVSDPELPSVHNTRSGLLEGPVREALARAGSGATALDLACNEGWFSHQLLEWGAARVVGIDVRERNIRRAVLLRDHFGVAPSSWSCIKTTCSISIRPRSGSSMSCSCSA